MASRELLFLVVFLSLLAFAAYASSGPIDPTQPYHPLQQISRDATMPLSVDVNDNGFIDNADDSFSVGGIVPGSQVISKGCVSLDTGQLGGNVWTGYAALDLLINGENICADGNGCTYSITRYDALSSLPNAAFTQSPASFFQGSTGGWFAAQSALSGINGDAAEAAFAQWQSGPLLAELWDDRLSTEQSGSQVTAYDAQSSFSFVFAFCD